MNRPNPIKQISSTNEQVLASKYYLLLPTNYLVISYA